MSCNNELDLPILFLCQKKVNYEKTLQQLILVSIGLIFIS